MEYSSLSLSAGRFPLLNNTVRYSPSSHSATPTSEDWQSAPLIFLGLWRGKYLVWGPWKATNKRNIEVSKYRLTLRLSSTYNKNNKMFIINMHFFYNKYFLKILFLPNFQIKWNSLPRDSCYLHIYWISFK